MFTPISLIAHPMQRTISGAIERLCVREHREPVSSPGGRGQSSADSGVLAVVSLVTPLAWFLAISPRAAGGRAAAWPLRCEERLRGILVTPTWAVEAASAV